MVLGAEKLSRKNLFHMLRQASSSTNKYSVQKCTELGLPFSLLSCFQMFAEALLAWVKYTSDFPNSAQLCISVFWRCWHLLE